MNTILCLAIVICTLTGGFAVEEKKDAVKPVVEKKEDVKPVAEKPEFPTVKGYTNLPLQGFQFSFVTFMDNMIPAYESGAYGIRAALPKTTETCYDQLGAWPDIIYETLSLYKTCQEQIKLLITNLYHGATAPLKNPIIRITPVDLIAVVSSFQLVGGGDNTQILSLQNLDKSIYNVIYNLFTTDYDNTLEVEQQVANSLVTADLATANGNHVIQEALSSFVQVISSKPFLDVQNNNKTIVFLNILRESMNELAEYYGGLSSIITDGGNSILKNASVQFATYGIPCSAISEVIIGVNNRIAEIYDEIANTLVTARANIMRYS